MGVALRNLMLLAGRSVPIGRETDSRPADPAVEPTGQQPEGRSDRKGGFMRLRASGAYTVGLALVASLGAASLVRAQADTTRPRVPVKKEQATVPAKAPTPAPAPTAAVPDTARRAAAGEVATPKDTAPPAVAAPTCAMMAAGRPTPADRMACGAMAATMPKTAPQQPKAKPVKYLFGNSGFYVGAGAGTAVPFNLLSDMGYDSGFDLTIPIGWQRPSRTLGIRATLAFDQVHADVASANVTAPAMLGSAPDPKIYTGTVDAVLKFPIGQLAREGRGLSLYTVGGGGVYLFRGFGGATELGNVLGGDKIGNSAKNVHKWGVNAGAGMEYGLGPTAVFVESRWVNVFTKGSQAGNDYLRWIPISVGVTLR